jgi:dTDP-4-dehydrorhamnose reductase/3'(2'),5'-bisphosphate nucleotidase
MKNKKNILITGANGQLALCIKKISASYPEFNFYFKTSSELDITQESGVKEIFNKITFHYCINCAAYTTVDEAEYNKNIAEKINVEGVRNLAIACKTFDVVLIHISTDFVFDGKKTTPYTEEDKVNPISIYGLTKLQGEKKIVELIEKYIIIRTSWLYSEYGNNFLNSMLRLGAERDSLGVVGDQIGTPTYAIDLAKVILTIICKNSYNYGIFHYSNEGIASWFDFAKAIFDVSETKLDLSPIKTEDYPTAAKRPAFSVMNKSKIKSVFDIEVPYWKDSLNIALINMDKNLKIAISASLYAGKEILTIYNEDFTVDYKKDNSPLTEADMASNKIIVNKLKQTEIPIISEENKQLPYMERKNWDLCWIVDPIDGTKEFIKKNGEFTVNIALVENGITKLGIIYVPVTQELYYTNSKKTKAYKTIVSVDDKLFEKLLFRVEDEIKPVVAKEVKIKVVGSRSHMNDETIQYIEDLRKEYDEVEIVSKGSSLKFCLVAEGKAHLYPRFAPTMEWDTAAGQAICEAVGVKVISKQTNKSLLYNKENLLNPWFTVS